MCKFKKKLSAYVTLIRFRTVECLKPFKFWNGKKNGFKNLSLQIECNKTLNTIILFLWLFFLLSPLAMWFRRRCKCEKFTIPTTTRATLTATMTKTTDNRQISIRKAQLSLRLRWATSILIMLANIFYPTSGSLFSDKKD